MIGKALLAATAMLAGGTAHAQRASYPNAGTPYVPYGSVPTDARVFSGLRVEAHLSYDRLSADLGDDGAVSGGRNGLGYGGEIGFDVPLGGVVLGAYAGADGSTIRDCEAQSATATACVRPGRSLLAGVRVGVPISSTLMLYAKGGYTNGQIRADYVDRSPNGISFSGRENLDGYHVGGGAELAFSPRTYGRVEYIYTRLRDRNSGDDGLSFNRSQVQAGFGFRF